MRYGFFIIFFIILSTSLNSQNIVVDSQTYTPQELIEDILIDSNCINNVMVTNVLGGNFGGLELSYGYFEANGSSFPFERGIVLSTGKLSNVPGPNTTLSDDDAPGWIGDSDLEDVLKENNTFNATIIEFDFTTIASEVSFRYLFASEEYQQFSPNTCQFSDLFGFLIRPVNTSTYTNIALIPDTNQDVKVTTVHSGIDGACGPINETYFGGWNPTTAPINFNGQTAVLTAIAQVVPNETYHVKLVIADEQNYRYDSAVFLEAGSFQLNTDLGPNKLIATQTALCEGEILVLDASQLGLNAYTWYKDGVIVDFQPSNCINCGTYTVTETGFYNVEIELENGCFSYGEVAIEYVPNPISTNVMLIECDDNQDGLTIYNLYDAETEATNGDSNLFIENFFLYPSDAQQNRDEIDSPTSFENTTPQQIVYARVVDQSRCFSISEITLNTSNNMINIPPFETCDDNIVDGYFEFNTSTLQNHIRPFVPSGSDISFYRTENEAFLKSNVLTGTFENITQNSDTIYVRVTNGLNCYAVSVLVLDILFTPILAPDDMLYYCEDTFPNPITLVAGIINDDQNNYTYEWFFNNQSIPNTNSPLLSTNEVGTYKVLVSYSNGCTSTRTITVKASGKAEMDYQLLNNNTVTVNATGSGNYEYAFDNLSFSSNNIFENVKPGFHTIFVSDINGCEIAEKLISIIGFPSFFTPNNDGFHDTWKPYGVNEEFFSDIQIQIFDRYGKLIKELVASENGWNGNFNGSLMPSDDYWFKVILGDNKIFTGHFTLKR